MVFVFLCLDDVPILSDVVVVGTVIHFKTLQFPKWWKSDLWQQKKKSSSSSLYIEECDFTWQVLAKIFYLVLSSCMNYHLTAKYKTEKRIAK